MVGRVSHPKRKKPDGRREDGRRTHTGPGNFLGCRASASPPATHSPGLVRLVSERGDRRLLFMACIRTILFVELRCLLSRLLVCGCMFEPAFGMFHLNHG